MTSKKTTRRALFSSVMSLLLCCSMLLGTTFAWFTDSVTSTGNIIKSGTLDVEMYYGDDASTPHNAATGAIFDYDLWEPGFTQTKYIKVENKGDLAFQYQLRVIPNDLAAEGTKLAEVIDVWCAIVEDGSDEDFGFEAPTRTGANTNFGSLVKLGTLKDLMANPKGVDDGVLLPGLKADGTSVGSDKVATIGGEQYTGHVTVCLALHMQEEAGNEYQNLSIGNGFNVQLIAAQMAYEMDSFDELYDQNAAWPVSASGSGSFATTPVGSNHFEVVIKDLNDASDNPNIKVATAEVHRDSVTEETDVVTISISSAKTNSNVTLTSDQTARTYEITANGLIEGNTVPVKMALYVGEGLSGVKLYHYDDEMTGYNYNPTSGYITFETATFSPFTVVFDVKTVEAEDPDSSDLPVANVTRSPEYENTDLEWGSYGQWSPTAGLDSNLEAAYTFACVDTAAEAKASPYADWYCDFYVKLDKDLGENQIFLGGNYGSFGWVGFHNGDLTLAADTEIGLLESVTTNPWTYADVAEFVGTFICGVGDVDDALSGATFTVMLRLTNPENENEYYNVSTIEYTFDAIETADALAAAMAAGGEVVLGTDISIADTSIVVGNGVDTVLDLNGHTISATNTRTATHNFLFDVKGGTLTIKDGAVEMKHTGTNMGWNGAATVIDVTAGGVLNIQNATVENLGGTDMNFAVHLNNWGEATLNVEQSHLKAPYMAVRVFNSGPDMNNVTIKGSTLTGKYCFWVHNYFSEDLGGKVYSGAQAAYDRTAVDNRLNFDIFGNGNTFEYSNENAPVLYGFNDAVYYDADGNVVG